ncbi:hypothetical protein Ciccas_001785 [Cichlidogyrus casuarinus]|uniref:Uncharacterized protein n=1 Tax=Cichlidogyrus casuarinus TaxID=1844966 RepID=A0ABD2QJ44_9PLAT
MFDFVLVFGRSQEILFACPYTNEAEEFIAKQHSSAKRNSQSYDCSQTPDFQTKDIISMLLSPLITQFHTLQDLPRTPVCTGIFVRDATLNRFFQPENGEIELRNQCRAAMKGGELIFQAGQNGCDLLGVIFHQTKRKKRLTAKDFSTRITNLHQKQLAMIQTTLDAIMGPYWADSIKMLNGEDFAALELVVMGTLRRLLSRDNQLLPDWNRVCPGFEKMKLNPEVRKILSKELIQMILMQKTPKQLTRTLCLSNDYFSDEGVIEHLFVVAPATGYVLSHVTSLNPVFYPGPQAWEIILNVARMLYLATDTKQGNPYSPWLQRVTDADGVEYSAISLLVKNERSAGELCRIHVHMSLLFGDLISDRINSLIIMCLERPTVTSKLKPLLANRTAGSSDEVKPLLIVLMNEIRLITKILRSELSLAEKSRKDLLQTISFLEELRSLDLKTEDSSHLPSIKIMNDVKFFLKHMERNLTKSRAANLSSFAITLRCFNLQLKNFFTSLILRTGSHVRTPTMDQLCEVTRSLNKQLDNFANFMMVKCSFKVLLTDLVKPERYPGLMQLDQLPISMTVSADDLPFYPMEANPSKFKCS